MKLLLLLLTTLVNTTAFCCTQLTQSQQRVHDLITEIVPEQDRGTMLAIAMVETKMGDFRGNRRSASRGLMQMQRIAIQSVLSKRDVSNEYNRIVTDDRLSVQLAYQHFKDYERQTGNRVAALVAYNVGIGAYKRHAPYSSHRYVKKVNKAIQVYCLG